MSQFLIVPTQPRLATRPGRIISAVWIGAFLLGLGLFLPEARADYGSLGGESLVVPGQGITATSRITEVVRIDISETNTDDLQTAEFDDDGGLEIRRVKVSFSDFRGIDPSNPGSEIAFVSFWRITQDIDNPLFDFQNDFLLEEGVSNILLARQRVTGTQITLDIPCEELADRSNTASCPADVDIPLVSSLDDDTNYNTEVYIGGDAFVLNREVTFMVAIETDATFDNNDQFAVQVELDADDIAHQNGSGNSFGTRRFGSNIITGVDSAGDLLPFPDVVTGGVNDFFYPFEPHNYPDL
ncbi:MAG: hypothetical protein KC931_24780, partial [Candidatus Omnitrophica bacterium]|nr:hypothetical protein [Candidatus Omnitrophota bacterium]